MADGPDVLVPFGKQIVDVENTNIFENDVRGLPKNVTPAMLKKINKASPETASDVIDFVKE